MKLFFALLSFALFIPMSQAADQNAEVQALTRFMGADRMHVHQGRDEAGSCRVMVYAQGDERRNAVSLEGTFQLPPGSGPAQGLVIPFLMSSQENETFIESLQISDATLFASVVEYSQNGAIRIQVEVHKLPDGTIDAIRYSVPNGVRTCSGMRRIL